MYDNWLKTRISKLPVRTRLRVRKSLLKATDLESHPLEKPAQPKDYDVWFHLLIDIYDGKDLDSHSNIKNFFSETIKTTKMEPLSDILIKTVDDSEGQGTSAIQLIVTSSLVFHSDDRHKNAFIDFFSCATYDPKDVVALVDKHFSPKKVKTNFIYRRED